MKMHKKTLTFILLAALVYGGGMILLALPLLSHHGIPQELQIDAVSSNRGKVGQPLHLNVTGTGFDQETRFMLVLDSGNQQAIISATETSRGTHTMLRDGDTLYLGSQERKIYQYDISQPDQPKYQTNYSMFGKPTALIQLNGAIWAASGLGELSLLGEIDDRPVDTITELAADARGNLYATAALQGLVVLRPDPQNIHAREIGSLELPGSTLSIAIADHLAYISSARAGLHICDISNAEHPRLISTLPWPGSNQSLTIKENLVFLSSTTELVIIDVQNPQQPHVLSHLPLAASYDMEIHDNLLLLAAGNCGLLAVDITDPAHPFISGHLTPGDMIRCLSVDGDRAYLGTDKAGLLVVDLKELGHHPAWRPNLIISPGTTTTVSSALQLYGKNLPAEVLGRALSQIPLECRKYDTTAIDSTTYLATDCGLIIINPNQPDPIEIVQEPLASAKEIQQVGTTAYISGTKQSTFDHPLKPVSIETGPGLQVFDVSDPTHPRARGFVETDDIILKMRIQENRAYLAVKKQGVLIVDLSDPDHPQVMGVAKLAWPEQNFANYLDIYLNGDVLYIANGRAGLHVFNVSNPRQPQHIAAINTPGGWINHLAGDKAQLFAYNFNNDLQRYDITEPESPRLTGTLDRFANMRDISIHENTLRIEFTGSFGLNRALPLPAEAVDLHGSTEADLNFSAPVFAGDYLLYAFNQQGRQQWPGLIHIEADQK